MGYTVHYSEEEQVVCINFTGTVGIEHYKQATIDATEISLDKGCRLILTDITKIINTASALEIIQLPKLYSKLDAAKKNISAIIVPENAPFKYIAKFLEIYASNRGFFVKLLSNRNDAIKWLKSHSSKSIETPHHLAHK